jgi:RND family efflux transporter MFP subunit
MKVDSGPIWRLACQTTWPCRVLVAISILTSGCSNDQAHSAKASFSKPVPVHIYLVEEETTRRRIQAVGSLFALEESTLSAQVEGRVDKVLVDVGDIVTESQPLILLDPRELRFELERQQGMVKQVRAQLGIGPNDPPPTDPKKIASVQRAEADLFDADRKYARAKEMFKDNLISQQQYDEAASRYESCKATYDLALQEVNRLKAQLISTEASAALAEKKLSDATIRAPYPGAVETRNVHPGEYLRLQSPILVLVRTDRLRARLAVPERWAGLIKEGATVDLHLEAFPGETFEGRISRINPTVSHESRTFEVEALLDNSGKRLKPGFFVQASMSSEREDRAIFVPEPAVNYRYGVYKVFLVQGNHVSEKQILSAGQTEDQKGQRFEVAEGLKPGDRVAVPISGDLHEGESVEEKLETSPPAR